VRSTACAVLDLSRLVAGNTLTRCSPISAPSDQGRAAAGDTLRAWQTNGVPVTWKLYSRSKKSLCLELRRPRGDRAAPEARAIGLGPDRELPPGILEKMGLAPAKLLERNPKLVVVRISGWGRTGPTASARDSAR